MIAWTPWTIAFTSASAVRSMFSMARSEEHTSELQSRENLVCRLLLEKKKKKNRRVPATQANTTRGYLATDQTRNRITQPAIPSTLELVTRLHTAPFRYERTKAQLRQT